MSEPQDEAPPPDAAAWSALLALSAAREPAAAVTDGKGETWRFDETGFRPEGLELDPLAAAWIDLYAPLAAGRAWCLAQMGQSLDGMIATESGDGFFVTGQASRVHVHRLRALSEALLVGWRTVAVDDPELTTRHCDGPSPRVVVVDPRGRLTGRPKLADLAERPPLHVTAPACASPDGFERLELEPSDGRYAPKLLRQALAEQGLGRLMIEGGGETVSRFLADGALDRLHVVVAPFLIGPGRPGVRGPRIARLAEAARPPARLLQLGAEALFELRFDRTESGA